MINRVEMLQKCEMYAGNDGEFKHAIINKLE